MGKVTSKLQVTVPKSIADQFHIRPGDTLTWMAAGDSIRILTGKPAVLPLDIKTRLRMFDQSTERVRGRSRRVAPAGTGTDRGWKREDLYERGRAR